MVVGSSPSVPIWACSSEVEHLGYIQEAVGASPSTPTKMRPVHPDFKDLTPLDFENLDSQFVKGMRHGLIHGIVLINDLIDKHQP